MNKKIESEIAIGILVIVAILVGGAFWMRAEKAQAPAAQPVAVQQPTPPALTQPAVQQPTTQPTQTDDTANWQTYTNTKYGYSLMAPKNFSIGVTDATSGNETPAQIAVDNDVPIAGDYMGDSVIINTDIGAHNIDDGKCAAGNFIKTVIADGQSVEICKGDNLHADFYSRILKTGMYAGIIGDKGKAQQTQEIFEKIISTFKFTN